MGYFFLSASDLRNVWVNLSKLLSHDTFSYFTIYTTDFFSKKEETIKEIYKINTAAEVDALITIMPLRAEFTPDNSS